MNPLTPVNFNSYGYVTKKLEQKNFDKLKEEIAIIRSDFDSATPHNQRLAGNIGKEFIFTKDMSFLSEELYPLIQSYEENFNYLKQLRYLTKDVPVVLKDTWVNFQAKHEFNPIHDHAGVFSFVIWVDVPYLSADEKAQSFGRYSNSNLAGSFCFYYTSSMGQIIPWEIPADRTFNGTIALFPATLPHAVYPFSSTDDYRVSVSGNLVFDVGSV